MPTNRPIILMPVSTAKDTYKNGMNATLILYSFWTNYYNYPGSKKAYSWDQIIIGYIKIWLKGLTGEKGYQKVKLVHRWINDSLMGRTN